MARAPTAAGLSVGNSTAACSAGPRQEEDLCTIGAQVAEMQGTPRVMPDLILLPDGTAAMVNGGQYGIAGGAPGLGLSSNGGTGTRCAELYNPAQPVGRALERPAG